jgi:predicted amidophosphoribosyltransferase
MALHQTFLFHSGALYPHYHLCYYLPRSVGRDELSRSLLNFKLSVPEDIQGWIDRALCLLPQDLFPPGICVVRALHHDELVANSGYATPLDLLGAALAANFKGRYLPQILRKSRSVRKINQLPTAEREVELRDIYYICMDPTGHSGSYLLIDDILTTGTTARAIIDALLCMRPDCQITLFTLAKASPAGN